MPEYRSTPPEPHAAATDTCGTTGPWRRPSPRKRILIEIAQTEAKRQRTERKRKANARKAKRLKALRGGHGRKAGLTHGRVVGTEGPPRHRVRAFASLCLGGRSVSLWTQTLGSDALAFWTDLVDTFECGLVQRDVGGLQVVL